MMRMASGNAKTVFDDEHSARSLPGLERAIGD